MQAIFAKLPTLNIFYKKSNIQLFLFHPLIISDTCGKDNVQSCSYTCNDLCHSYRAVSYQCAHAKLDGCVDTCGEEYTKCSKGQALRDATTCIKTSECPCAIGDGTIIAVSINTTLDKIHSY